MPSVLLEHTLSHPGRSECQQPHAATATALRPRNYRAIQSTAAHQLRRPAFARRRYQSSNATDHLCRPDRTGPDRTGPDLT